jgi:hypothetical protein
MSEKPSPFVLIPRRGKSETSTSLTATLEPPRVIRKSVFNCDKNAVLLRPTSFDGIRLTLPIALEAKPVGTPAARANSDPFRKKFRREVLILPPNLLKTYHAKWAAKGVQSICSFSKLQSKNYCFVLAIKNLLYFYVRPIYSPRLSLLPKV